MTDIERYRQGEIGFKKIYDKYQVVVNSYAKKYFVDGYDRDDIRQFCYECLLEAIEIYDSSKGSNEESFINMIIKRKLFTLIAKHKREKRDGDVISFDKPLVIGVGLKNDYKHYIEDERVDVVKSLITKEELEEVVSHLTELEREAVTKRSKGYSYEMIADDLGVTEKSVDNALYRCKRKAKKIKEVM